MTRKILLVEDNPDDVDLTVSVMKDQGVGDVDVAEDGVAALAYLETKLPDLMLVDLKLPRMDGLELLRRVRADARLRHLPIVILTSSIQDSDVASSYASGANSYVRKPVDYDEFVQIARKLGEYWLDINHPPPVQPT